MSTNAARSARRARTTGQCKGFSVLVECDRIHRVRGPRAGRLRYPVRHVPFVDGGAAVIRRPCPLQRADRESHPFHPPEETATRTQQLVATVSSCPRNQKSARRLARLLQLDRCDTVVWIDRSRCQPSQHAVTPDRRSRYSFDLTRGSALEASDGRTPQETTLSVANDAG